MIKIKKYNNIFNKQSSINVRFGEGLPVKDMFSYVSLDFLLET